MQEMLVTEISMYARLENVCFLQIEFILYCVNKEDQYNCITKHFHNLLQNKK